MTQPLDDLAGRLASLERSNRRMKCGLVVIVVSLVAMAAAGGPPRSLDAQEFLLKDKDGKVRVRLGLSEMLYALPPPGASSTDDAAPFEPKDPLDLLDRHPGHKQEQKGQEVRVSIACLTFMGTNGSPVADQCTSWEDPAQSSLRFRVGPRDDLVISADRERTLLQLGGVRSRRHPEDRGRMAIAVHSEGAWLKLWGPPKREVLLDLESLVISDDAGTRVRLPMPASPSPAQ